VTKRKKGNRDDIIIVADKTFFEYDHRRHIKKLKIKQPNLIWLVFYGGRGGAIIL